MVVIIKVPLWNSHKRKITGLNINKFGNSLKKVTGIYFPLEKKNNNNKKNHYQGEFALHAILLYEIRYEDIGLKCV